MSEWWKRQSELGKTFSALIGGYVLLRGWAAALEGVHCVVWLRMLLAYSLAALLLVAYARARLWYAFVVGCLFLSVPLCQLGLRLVGFGTYGR